MPPSTIQELDRLAVDVVLGIDHFLLDQNIIGSILDTYKKICRSDSVRRLAILEQLVTDEMQLRLRFECICFSVFLASLQSPKYLTNRESVELFNGAIATALVEHSKETGMNKLYEIILVAIDPEPVFGLGDPIDPLNRLEEYRASFTKEQGNELEQFGKWLGKALDASNYPLFEIIGGTFGKLLLQLSDYVISGVFMRK